MAKARKSVTSTKRRMVDGESGGQAEEKQGVGGTLPEFQLAAATLLK